MVQQVWVCQDEWQTLPLDCDLCAGVVPTCLLTALFPVDCTMANVSIGHSNLPWSENGVQVLISPIKLFVRGDQVQKLCDSIEAYSVESVFFKKDVLDDLPLLRNVRVKQRHIISFTSRHQISMATLARCMLGVGISTVFCSNFGVKTRLMDKKWSDHEWFVRLFELAKEQSIPLSMTMDFGFNMNALPRQFPIPPASQCCIYGFDPSYKFERHPSSTLYPLFSSTSGAPMVNYFTSTERRQVAYCVDDTCSTSVGTTQVELIKVKVYSEIYHLLMGHNKTRSKQFSLSKTTVKQANISLGACRAFVEDAWSAKRFKKSAGCRIEFSFQITDVAQLSYIRGIVLSATQLALMRHLHLGIRYIPREQYESNLLKWLNLLDRSIPKSRLTTVVRVGVVHYLHGMLNANGHWNRSIGASLAQLVEMHRTPEVTFDSIVQAKETFRLFELESYISSNFRESLVLHRDSNIWPIQMSAVLFVSRTKVDLSKRGVSVLKNPPLFGVQLQNGCSEYVLPSRSPMELFEIIWAKWHDAWTSYVLLLPKSLRRNLAHRDECQDPPGVAQSSAFVPVEVPMQTATHRDTDLEKALFFTGDVGLDDVKKHISIQTLPKSGLYMVRNAKGRPTNDIAPNRDVNLLCKAVWKKHANKWRKVFSTTAERVLSAKPDPSSFFQTRKTQSTAGTPVLVLPTSIPRPTSTSQPPETPKPPAVSATKKRIGVAPTLSWVPFKVPRTYDCDDAPLRICTLPGTDKRDEYNLSNALFLEPNLEFSKAKLWLDIFIHPKFYSTPGFLPVFAVSTKDTPGIWDGVRCVEDPNAFVRSVVLACPDWEQVLRLRKKKRSILSRSQFMEHCTDPNSETSRSEVQRSSNKLYISILIRWIQ
ncbi:hypothetical protein DYB35_008262 [Aphanomyces astaci]|uniref:Uncharacterized protein n=1 Tax=Aphanomyces astaci TaxID=112090 RepID=A0A418D1N6_APHAT|nr:hypothetical protein DYB35_008262 [Aphanomyces astaci]